eukprot:TRINITY_DN5116_c0_g1_i6.p1 TRINITY_DN5116_c0_g1~~TRINITY_DN5116_c0_g1_i6.p1  ORF type:complete len:1108 (-),score=119.93 TRINITY_DN5116_c0_g1_i6:125-3157(-)
MIPVGLPLDAKVRIKVTPDTFADLAARSLISKTTPNMTASEKFARCAQENRECPSTDKSADNCCYFHVNVHSCLNKPGIFCGPWVGNDGFLATHTAAQTGFAGLLGETTFSFPIKLFWEGQYTIIAHFKLAAIHFAIGLTSTLSFSSSICPTTLVPNLAGDCEPCLEGAQPLSLGIPKGAKQLSAEEANALGRNPLCVPCPPGWFSRNGTECHEAEPGFFQNESGQAVQLQCPPGFSNPIRGATHCIECGIGRFAISASPNCDLCPKGTYGDSAGLSECERCEGQRTTDSMGLSSPSTCLCPAGTYAGPSDGACIDCPEAMTCKFGSAYDSFANWTAESIVTIPELKAGYYSKPSNPMSIFRCHAIVGASGCPGGAPGTCGQGRVGLVCAKCPDSETADGDGACGTCSSSNIFFVFLCCLVLMSLVVWLYVSSNDKLKDGASNSLTVTSIIALALMYAQVLAIFPQLDLTWPAVLADTMKPLAIVLLSPDSFVGVDCLSPASTTAYMLRCLPPFLCVAAVMFMACISQAAGYIKADLRWEWDKTLNTTGQLLQSVFVGITLLVSQPFQCYSHPTGDQSLSISSNVICWSPDHTPIVTLGLVVAAMFVIPFLATCLWASRQIVATSTSQHNQLARRFRFLFYRYRPDVWWWGIAHLVRMTLYAFSPSLPADEPHLQLMWMHVVSVVYLGAVCHFWAWKNPMLNMLDVFISSQIGVITICATAFLSKPADSSAYTSFAMMSLWTVVLHILMCLGVCMYWTKQSGLFGKFGSSKVNGHSLESIIDEFYEYIQRSAALPIWDLQMMAKDMNEYDLSLLCRVIGSFQAREPNHFGTPIAQWSRRLTTSSQFDITESLEVLGAMKTCSGQANADGVSTVGDDCRESTGTECFPTATSFDNESVKPPLQQGSGLASAATASISMTEERGVFFAEDLHQMQQGSGLARAATASLSMTEERGNFFAEDEGLHQMPQGSGLTSAATASISMTEERGLFFAESFHHRPLPRNIMTGVSSRH